MKNYGQKNSAIFLDQKKPGFDDEKSLYKIYMKYKNEWGKDKLSYLPGFEELKLKLINRKIHP